MGSVAFALPGISFAILAGLLFGPVLGTICCTVAATLGAVAAFLLGRYFLKDTVGAAARKNTATNQFHNFEQRTYDFNDLESRLLDKTRR